MIFDGLRAVEATRFGRELAEFMMNEMSGALDKRDARFARRIEKLMAQAEGRIQDFKARERLNLYQKARLSNSFLWQLKDRGCPHDYADELTEWVSVRL